MPESYYSDANCLTSKEVQFRRINPCKWTSLPRQQDLVSLLFPDFYYRVPRKRTGDCFRLRIVYSTRKLFKFRISLKLLLPENRDVSARSKAKLDISSRASQFVFGRYWKNHFGRATEGKTGPWTIFSALDSICRVEGSGPRWVRNWNIRRRLAQILGNKIARIFSYKVETGISGLPCLVLLGLSFSCSRRERRYGIIIRRYTNELAFSVVIYSRPPRN